MRNLAALLSPAQIVDLKARTPAAAVKELVQAIPGPGPALQRQMIRTILARESTLGTGIGNGIAVPHGRLEKLSRLYVALGRAPKGIDFRSPDRTKTTLVLLIVTPASQVGAYLQILASALWTLSDDTLRREILEAADPKAVLAVLARRKPARTATA